MDELFGAQGTSFFSTGLGVAIAEGHTIPCQLQDPVVANGHPENVRGQILQGVQTRADRFTVHNPLLLPDLRRDARITISASQRLLEFATKNFGEGAHWQEEIVSCR